MKQSPDHRAGGNSSSLESAIEAEAATERAVAIAGVGLITPLADGAGASWEALLEGKFIRDHAPAAGAYQGTWPRVIQMARRVADEALAQANWLGDNDYAVVVGTSKGSVVSWLESREAAEFTADRTWGLNPVALGDMAANLSVAGQARLTVSAACASGLVALIRGAMMIRAGEAARVLVVAAEASVHPLFLGSFRRLGLLPDLEIGCRPFDEGRDGFFMSEAAAAVCLEASGAGRSNNSASIEQGEAGGDVARWVMLDRYAMGADATHLTALDPNGEFLRRLIRQVRGDQTIDLVHAHGTATLANDPVELAAIEAEMDGRAPLAHLYSHKGALGHSLGASGLVAVVLNVLAHRREVVLPNVRTSRPLVMRKVLFSQTAVKRPIRRSMVLAAGFGGATAAVSLVTR